MLPAVSIPSCGLRGSEGDLCFVCLMFSFRSVVRCVPQLPALLHEWPYVSLLPLRGYVLAGSLRAAPICVRHAFSHLHMLHCRLLIDLHVQSVCEHGGGLCSMHASACMHYVIRVVKHYIYPRKHACGPDNTKHSPLDEL